MAGKNKSSILNSSSLSIVFMDYNVSNPIVHTFTMTRTKRRPYQLGSNISPKPELLVSQLISTSQSWVDLVFFISKQLFQEWSLKLIAIEKLYKVSLKLNHFHPIWMSICINSKWLRSNSNRLILQGMSITVKWMWIIHPSLQAKLKHIKVLNNVIQVQLPPNHCNKCKNNNYSSISKWINSKVKLTASLKYTLENHQKVISIKTS